MQEQGEKWTRRGVGVYTDDEEDVNQQEDSPDGEEVCPAGSFGQRLSRLSRHASKTSVVTIAQSGSEDKEKSADEELTAAKDSGRKDGSESTFASDSRSNGYNLSSLGGHNNENAAAGSAYAGRRRFRKPLDAVRRPRVPLQESNTAFSQPPRGFVHSSSSRGSRVRNPGKFDIGQRSNGSFGRTPPVASLVATVPSHVSPLPGVYKAKSPPKPAVPGFPVSCNGPKGHLPSGGNAAPKKKVETPEYVDATERLQRLSLNDVAVVDDEQESGGHSAASIVPLVERAPSVGCSTRNADHKEQFLGCVAYYSERIFDMLHAKGQGHATAQFKQRLLDLFADMERSVSTE